MSPAPVPDSDRHFQLGTDQVLYGLCGVVILLILVDVSGFCGLFGERMARIIAGILSCVNIISSLVFFMLKGTSDTEVPLSWG